MDKTKINGVRIQTVGVVPVEYNNAFSNPSIGLDGNLLLWNPAFGTYLRIQADGVNGEIGTYNPYPLPSYIAKYGFTLATQFDMNSMATLRDLTTEKPLGTLDSIVLLKETEYASKLKVLCPALPEFHEKTFIRGTNTGTKQFYTREDTPNFYLNFDIDTGEIMLMETGSYHTKYVYNDVNVLVTTDITILNTFANVFKPVKPVNFEAVSKKMKRTGSVATVIRRK